MPDFAGSKIQREAGKYIYAGLLAPHTPPPGLQPGLHRKTTFCFSSSPAGKTVTSNILQHPARSLPVPSSKHLSGPIPYRALHFTTATTYLPAPAGQQPFAAYLSILAASQSSASQRPPFRLDRPMHSLSHSFFIFFLSFFIPLHQKKETGKADFLFFLAITNLVQIQPKHLLCDFLNCFSRRPISIFFRTGHAVVIHKRHQVICIFDFSLDFGNLLFFFFF